jgi:hypothetical protein
MNSYWSRSFFISLLLFACTIILGLLPIFRQESEPEATIIYESFEGSTPLVHPFIVDTFNATPHSRTYVSEFSFKGKKSARIELRDTDPEIAKGTRSEIAFKPARQKEQWYSFAMLFPADSWEPDSYPEIISQWHAFPDEALGEQWRSPATKLLVLNDRLRMDIGYHTAKVNSDVENEFKYDLGPLPKDTWQHFVFRIKHDVSEAGVVEIWINGSKVLKHTGGNSYNDDLLPYWKVGLYKWSWNGTRQTDVDLRVLYLDEVSIRTSYTTLNDQPKTIDK